MGSDLGPGGLPGITIDREGGPWILTVQRGQGRKWWKQGKVNQCKLSSKPYPLFLQPEGLRPSERGHLPGVTE